ncbi:MAG: transglycosylase SLT domain-containing protein [Candidatus Rokubacteria bacterium]|nr:transglycosylase SLT domain-containing protein [Candidatus Rokubacteria bacterium]
MLGRFREPVRAWTDPVGRALFRLRLRPNHLTVIGLGVSSLAATAFVAGRVRAAGLLLILAGLCDFFDGALARVSGQVTPFGGFLDSVIDRYSDLLVLLGIVVLFARTPHTRGAVVATAGLIGSMMVSYTKARAESIGVRCTVGMMERPERMICLIAGALLDLLEPALWVLAILSNLTALQRIAFTWRATRDRAAQCGLVLAAALLVPAPAAAGPPPRVTPDLERAWAQAVEAYQRGEPAALVREFGRRRALESPIGDHVRYLLAEALVRQGDLAAARAAAVSVADRYRESRLAPKALLLAATLASGEGRDGRGLLARLVARYPDAAEAPVALYLLGLSAETRGQRDLAAETYRQVRLLAPTTGYADAATDRLAALEAAGVSLTPFTLAERVDRAERLLRGGVPAQAADEAERIVADTREPSIALRALRVVADGARALGRYAFAARALELAIPRAPAEQQTVLQLERAKLLARAGQRQQALAVFDLVAVAGAEAEASEALYHYARLLDEVDRGAAAAEVYRAVAARYPSREVAGASLWRLGWLAWAKDDAREAGQSWTRVGEPGADRAYRLPALYWAGRARERQGDRAAAEGLFARVLAEAPRTYYGVLAAARAPAATNAGAKAGVALPAEPSRAVAADPGFARVELLRRIGLVEDALQELEELSQRAVGDPVRLYGLSSAYVKEARYHLALRIFRRSLAQLAATGDPALPRAFWEMFYPFGWRAEVTDAAARAGLDPYLVAAVVREESSYYPRAVSRAGARGLMQLLPQTAKLLAPAGDLDDPALNLQLGARFLAALLREFSDPRLALAAYNAGPARLRQWWSARRTDDVEAFIEQIPYDETRHYVKRVVLSWDEYRRLYAGH